MEDYPRPDVTVDIVPLTLHENKLCVLLAERDKQPFKGELALLGGYIHIQEDNNAGSAARRVLREKAGITQLYMEQLSTFSGRDRDPRGWSVSIAYFSLVPYDHIKPAMIQNHLHLAPVEQIADLPFDHSQIINAAVNRIKGKGAYSDLPARFLGDEFSMRELHQVYSIILNEKINEDAFRRKILDRGFLQKTGNKRFDEGATRPASLYRLQPGYAVFDRRV